jgi:hypothetical protein
MRQSERERLEHDCRYYQYHAKLYAQDAAFYCGQGAHAAKIACKAQRDAATYAAAAHATLTVLVQPTMSRSI